MISSIRLDGSTACMALEGTTDTESFRAYVDQILVPTLRPGDIVVMDNLSPHKSDPTRALITNAGAQAIFLPASVAIGIGVYVQALNPDIPSNLAAGVGTTVYTSRNAGHGLTPFNPFTTTPIQCPTGDTAAQCTALGANYQVSPTFGQPLTPTTASTQGAYQLPRTITISLGVRF